MDFKKTNTPIPTALFVAALVFALFYPSVGFEFLRLDDGQYVAQNSLVAGGLTLGGVAAAFLPYQYYWIPVTWLSFMAGSTLHGMAPWGFHLE
ncbi:hypothetical protein FDZ71_03140, partial [bacterium]